MRVLFRWLVQVFQLLAYGPQKAVAHCVHQAFRAAGLALVPSGAQVDGGSARDHSGLHGGVGVADSLQARGSGLDSVEPAGVWHRRRAVQQLLQLVAHAKGCIPLGVAHV